MLLYRALAGLLVPVFVIFIIPYWLVNAFPTQPPNLILEVLGSIVFIGGFLLAGWCMLLFFNIGRGTIMLPRRRPFASLRAGSAARSAQALGPDPQAGGSRPLPICAQPDDPRGDHHVSGRGVVLWVCCYRDISYGLFPDQPRLFHLFRGARVGETL